MFAPAHGTQLIMQGHAFLNAFGTKDGIGDGLTPRNIIDNLPHVDYNDLKYELGQYVQLHVQKNYEYHEEPNNRSHCIESEEY